MFAILDTFKIINFISKSHNQVLQALHTYMEYFSLQVFHNQMMMYLNQHKRKTKVENPSKILNQMLKKPCQPNCEHGEIIALVATKREKHMANMMVAINLRPS